MAADENTPLEEEEVKPDRLLAFSDGEDAIAITLLVLNIHIPQLPCFVTQSGIICHESHGMRLWDALKDQWQSYLSFLLSFFIIGIVWGNHHTMFSYVKRQKAARRGGNTDDTELSRWPSALRARFRALLCLEWDAGADPLRADYLLLFCADSRRARLCGKA